MFNGNSLFQFIEDLFNYHQWTGKIDLEPLEEKSGADFQLTQGVSGTIAMPKSLEPDEFQEPDEIGVKLYKLNNSESEVILASSSLKLANSFANDDLFSNPDLAKGINIGYIQEKLSELVEIMYELKDQGVYDELINVPTTKEVYKMKTPKQVREVASDIQQRYFPGNREFNCVEKEPEFGPISEVFTKHHLFSYLGVFTPVFYMGLEAITKSLAYFSSAQAVSNPNGGKILGVLLGGFAVGEMAVDIYKGSKPLHEKPMYETIQENE